MASGIFLNSDGRGLGYPKLTALGAIPVEIVKTVATQLFPAVVAKTANYTILSTDTIGTLFTNRGATGAVTFTLFNGAKAGDYFFFLAVAAQNLVIATATADTMLTFNDAEADSVAFSTTGQIIGGFAIAIFDGTQWAVINLSNNTATVAT